MGEIDRDICSVWEAILDPEYCGRLCEKILGFNMNFNSVRSLISKPPETNFDRAFQTIIRNRVQRGGVIASGAGLMNRGENGRGVGSRWYPETLSDRILKIGELSSKISFREGDAFSLIDDFSNEKDAVFFIDPPYTMNAGGGGPGTRLYKHNQIDHVRLFNSISKIKGVAAMTYDDSDEVISMARKFNFKVSRVAMKNSHNTVKHELLILKY